MVREHVLQCRSFTCTVARSGITERMKTRPKQIRFKSQTSPAGKEPALQIYYGHLILSDNKYLSYCAFKQGGLNEYVCSVAC